MKLSLGTAGWRSTYGAVPSHPLSIEEISFLTQRASQIGFDWIDTAPGYGDSELCLGLVSPPQLIATKLVVNQTELLDVNKSVDNSLLNLNTDALELVFVHNWDNLQDPEKELVSECLEGLVGIGKLKRWGFSSYDVTEILRFSEMEYRNVYIQINSNVLDQRLLENDFSTIARRFITQNHKLWLRSIFLQGVLIDQSTKNPFSTHEAIIKLKTYSLETGYTPMEICLGYALSLPIVDCLILGVNNSEHLRALSAALESAPTGLDFGVLKSNDLQLIDPRNWGN